MKKYLMIAALLASVSLALAEGKPQTTCPVMKGSPVSPRSLTRASALPASWLPP